MTPTINLPKRKEKTNQRNEHTDTRELRRKTYNDTRWKKLRILYLQQHPLCEECLSRGVVNAGSQANPLQVHHKKSPFYKNEVNWQLFLDENNLETICSECHGKIHAKEQGHISPEEIIRQLEELFGPDED